MKEFKFITSFKSTHKCPSCNEVSSVFFIMEIDGKQQEPCCQGCYKQAERDAQTTYSLLENGFVHTKGLSKQQASEMLERHSRIFEDIYWEIRPEIESDVEMEGFIERHNRIARNYYSV